MIKKIFACFLVGYFGISSAIEKSDRTLLWEQKDEDISLSILNANESPLGTCITGGTFNSNEISGDGIIFFVDNQKNVSNYTIKTPDDFYKGSFSYCIENNNLIYAIYTVQTSSSPSLNYNIPYLVEFSLKNNSLDESSKEKIIFPYSAYILNVKQTNFNLALEAVSEKDEDEFYKMTKSIELNTKDQTESINTLINLEDYLSSLQKSSTANEELVKKFILQEREKTYLLNSKK